MILQQNADLQDSPSENGIVVDGVMSNGVRHRSSSVALNGNSKIHLMGKLALTLLFAQRFSSELYTTTAFSVSGPESITSKLSSPSAGQTPAPTTLFLFSLRNSNDDEDDNTNDNRTKKGTGTTATLEKPEGKKANDENEDFSAWMDGIRRATSSLPGRISNEDDPESVINELNGVKGLSRSDSKSKIDTSSNNISLDNNARQKSNPLSNLIQFESMLELTQIALKNEANEKEEIEIDTRSSDSNSGIDVFTAFDRLVKTFQKQEEDKQKGRNELLQFSQVAEKIIAEESLVKDDTDIKVDSDGNDTGIKGISTTTTMRELMEFGISFPKVNSIWDTFSGKSLSALSTEEDIMGDNTMIDDIDINSIASAQSPKGSASSSPLFRGKETNGVDKASNSANLSQAAESILKDTTNKMEFLVAEASSAIFEKDEDISNSSNSAIQDLVDRASSVFDNNEIPTRTTGTAATGIVETITSDIVTAAQKIAKDSGVDINVQFAADRAREATEYAVGVTTTANMVLDAGYAYGSRSGAAGMSGRDDNFNYIAASAATQTAGSVLSESSNVETPTHQPPLFGDFASAQRIEPYEYDNVVFQGAEMGILAGAIYADPVDRCHKSGYSLVANGTTANVAWMVTDSVMDRERYASSFCHHDDAINKIEDDSEDIVSGPVMIRTITMRGFDASDESVDREALLNEICFATAEPMDDATAEKVVFHKGLLNIARQIYAETSKYIDWASPSHKIILNGHSVGGSLAVLMLLLITSEHGANYARDRILRVYSHGSPPVAALTNDIISQSNTKEKFGGTQRCPVLESFDLPSSMVYGFIQPYDPVVRLFSDHDVLYPLVDDLSNDGITLYSSGPIRSLRPITRAIFQAWDGWPQFRDNWKGTCDMQYQSIGIQHVLLPEPLRYLNDRFISVNVGVPPVEAIVRISPVDLLPALDQTFPLDTFQVSLVPQAVRSFLHHFYPAYDSAISEYASKIKCQKKFDVSNP